LDLVPNWLGVVTVFDLSINYEYQVFNHALLRFGIGGGYKSGWEQEHENSLGLLSAIQWLTSGSADRFEYGVGISLNKFTKVGESEWKVKPAVILGYRYEEYSG
jgi:hypothetical protein